MRLRATLLRCSAFPLALLLGAFPPVPAQAADTVTIAAMLPLTGNAAFLGKSETEALTALETTINHNGGIRGRSIHFATFDNAGDPQLEVQLINTAIASKPAAIIDGGPLSTCRAAAAIVASSGPLLYCLSPSIHPDPGSYVFSGLNSSRDILEVSIKYLRERGLRKIAVLNGSDATGQDGDAAIAAALKSPANVRAGMTLVANEHFNLGDLSVAAQLARIKAAGAQALIAFVTGTPISTVLHGLQDAGMAALPVVTSTGNGIYAQMESLNGVMPKELLFAGPPLLVPAGVTDAGVRRAIDQFAVAFQPIGPHRGDILHGVVWDIGSIIANALRKAGPDASPAMLRAAIAGDNDFAGVLGKYDFRAVPQRGLSANWLIVERWSPPDDGWIAVSKPGGDL